MSGNWGGAIANLQDLYGHIMLAMGYLNDAFTQQLLRCGWVPKNMTFTREQLMDEFRKPSGTAASIRDALQMPDMADKLLKAARGLGGIRRPI